MVLNSQLVSLELIHLIRLQSKCWLEIRDYRNESQPRAVQQTRTLITTETEPKPNLEALLNEQNRMTNISS